MIGVVIEAVRIEKLQHVPAAGRRGDQPSMAPKEQQTGERHDEQREPDRDLTVDVHRKTDPGIAPA
ncbi:hypothetical protein ACVOMT_22445 [Sphingomonas panni]